MTANTSGGAYFRQMADALRCRRRRLQQAAMRDDDNRAMRIAASYRHDVKALVSMARRMDREGGAV